MLGAGSWGTALAILLSHKGLDVRLWGNLPHEIEQLTRERQNSQYLPGIAFPDSLSPRVELAEALHGAR